MHNIMIFVDEYCFVSHAGDIVIMDLDLKVLHMSGWAEISLICFVTALWLLIRWFEGCRLAWGRESRWTSLVSCSLCPLALSLVSLVGSRCLVGLCFNIPGLHMLTLDSVGLWVCGFSVCLEGLGCWSWVVFLWSSFLFWFLHIVCWLSTVCHGDVWLRFVCI